MLNKLILRAFFSITLALSFTGAANAALITQDLISGTDGVIGSVSIDTAMADDWDIVTDWVSFEIGGYAMSQPPIFFEAVIDTMDFYAGIQSLNFDVNDTCTGCEWAYNGSVEAGFGGTVDIFDVASNDLVTFWGDVTFGQATVVPTPATLVLFLTAVAGLAARRKITKL
ncbi:PEP-CTERM sorting domain-containing protein [Colwellia psychrerythraea]|uniref:PEP motif anchor domain protein n=1 Tax=Colwellia psychrerythraea TaxID=28229 RepID=A0A099KEM8_COLPS|nr:PEP-CTERM sorting domain-containing protein [Colwellia psychrerythraea]KGJ89199.1 hypothetical protein GAB14E_4195 [Colwellia psychrerythraea]